ncbi:MAG: VWA domain-containing protein [Propionibacteriales bacterium]|nr:VWA domain-containing protein [Propionibacteriales bacterium]
MSGRHSATPPKASSSNELPVARIAVVVVTVMLVTLLGVGARAVFGGAGSCSGDTAVRVVVTPELAPVIEQAAKELNRREVALPEGCADFQVKEQTAAAMLQAVEDGEAELPELWIPDASAWLGELPKGDVPDDASVRKLAKSPVVLVGHKGAAEPATWLSALSSKSSIMLDPRSSSAGLGTLAAIHGESIAGKSTGTELAGWMVGAAQRTGSKKKLTEGTLFKRAGESTVTAPGYFPSTEQRYLQRIAADPDLPITAQVPKSGSVLLDYPLARLAGGGYGPAFAALGDYFGTAAGWQSLIDAGFRPPSGKAPKDSDGVADVIELGLVDAPGLDRLLRQWVTLSVRTRMLAVIDVSGSMAEAAGNKTRMQLATEAATESLAFMPDDAQVGVWAFSIGLGSGNRDYRELAPTRTLGSTSEGGSHRKKAEAAISRLSAIVGGGTGLYDSTLAAFRTAMASHDSARSNSIVVLTDGRNEDENGLSLAQLLDTLEREVDPARPLQIITIGMGPDADTKALKKIAAVSGGQSYTAEDPRDIGKILTSALLERVGWGLR